MRARPAAAVGRRMAGVKDRGRRQEHSVRMSIAEEEIQQIIESRHQAPHAVLGPHYSKQEHRTVIRVFLPQAKEVFAAQRGEGRRTVKHELVKIHPSGLFEGSLSGLLNGNGYWLIVTDQQGAEHTLRDPYAIKRSAFTEEDLAQLAAGEHLQAFRLLGAHPSREGGVDGVWFSLWAPNAARVSVVGTFNEWDGRLHQMRLLGGSGIWELFIPEVPDGALYKYEIKTQAGNVFLKTDPYATSIEASPNAAAIVCRLERAHDWNDQSWRAPRSESDDLQKTERAIYLFEIDLQAWAGSGGEGAEGAYYRSLASPRLISEVKGKGFTHVLIPLSANPSSHDGLCYAPSRSCGTPADLMALIDFCHQSDIGVVVPGMGSSIPVDGSALNWFDGTRLYESETRASGARMRFAFDRGEIKSALLSSVMFWQIHYHVDAVIVDPFTAALHADCWRERHERPVPASLIVRGERHPTRLPEHEIQRLVHGRHRDPFAILGPHVGIDDNARIVRAFVPRAEQVYVVMDGYPWLLHQLTSLDTLGLFEGTITPLGAELKYRVQVLEPGGRSDTYRDPYAYRSWLFTLYDRQLFNEGNHYHVFCKLGAHLQTRDGAPGVNFAVWAPNAEGVSVVGRFNNWTGSQHQMKLHEDAGVWELFVPDLGEGELYKYEIRTSHGGLCLKADPYAFYCEVAPQTASIVYAVRGRYRWQDEDWMARRAVSDMWTSPVAIYEVHVGSWMRTSDGRSLSYTALAERLVPYVKSLGFTHIELLPIAEHPYEPSWGYQISSFYAPTSRFGRPEDLMAFIDRCHQEGIGVILDWVPAHFPKDAHALGRFDGTNLYEHADPRKGEHRDWGTLIFNYGRHEVENFLIANAFFWLETYHFDGLRVDAVASMLYLDYSRRPGEWIPNMFGGNENLEAIEFLKHTNSVVHARFPGVMLIAEESTAWPRVSKPVDAGGLGFGFKWNMGWMHDVLAYMQEPPERRRQHYRRLTFGFHYAFDENFVLSLSHDEVVHLKRSLLEKMPGDEWQAFANLRLLYAFMYAHPGKKLMFMGGEIGQRREWNHATSLDWPLLELDPHRGLSRFVADLNGLYRAAPALHEVDFGREGFEGIDLDSPEQNVIAFLRKARDPRDTLLFVANFSAVSYASYRVGVPFPTFYRELLNSDAAAYGGHGRGLPAQGATAEEKAWHGYRFSLSLPLPPLTALVLQPLPAAIPDTARCTSMERAGSNVGTPRQALA